METPSKSELFKGEGKSKTAIFAFGGCALLMGGIQPFEFVGTISKNFPDIDTYFFIDKNQCWYHKGLQGINESVDEMSEYLGEKMSKYEKTIFIGNSAGGYASLLYASLLNADVCLSFVPQTDLNLVVKTFPNKYDYSKLDSRYMDIVPHLNTTTQYELYSENLTNDVMHHKYHTQRLVDTGMANIKQHYCPGGVKGLRNRGELPNVIKQHLIWFEKLILWIRTKRLQNSKDSPVSSTST